jgi:hypothetical protein
VKALLTLVRTDVQRHLALYDIARLPTHRGRTDDAAGICTWADDVHAAKREPPRPVARHCRNQLQAPLTSARCADALAQPDAEGCRMTDDQACAFAFPRLESKA